MREYRSRRSRPASGSSRAGLVEQSGAWATPTHPTQYQNAQTRVDKLEAARHSCIFTICTQAGLRANEPLGITLGEVEAYTCFGRVARDMEEWEHFWITIKIDAESTTKTEKN